MSVAEFRERDAHLEEVARLVISVPERLALLGVTPAGIEELRRGIAAIEPHRAGWTSESLCLHYRIGAAPLALPGGTSGTNLGELNGWMVLAWTL